MTGGTIFMIYEKERELAQASFQEWFSEEVFTYQWFIIVGVMITAYVVWLKLVNRRRGTELLLIGSLVAVAKAVYILIIGNELGLFDYTIRLLPITVNIFAAGVTISPIIVMLVHQYTSSWKGYLLWSAIGFAFLNLVIFPVYVVIGALEFHNGWNVFYHFLAMYAISVCVRVVFLWITGTQKRLTEKAG